MFNSLPIKRVYRSNSDNIDTDFVIPVLTESKTYDRCSGYFSLSALSDLSIGIIPYIKNGGTIRVVTSLQLDMGDLQVIHDGYKKAHEIIEAELNRLIDEEIDEKSAINLDLITNLIAANRLQIKVAYLPNGGIYHEKSGYFEDRNGNTIWYSGSVNETYSGYKKNLENIVVLISWRGDNNEIYAQQQYFNNLWLNNSKSIKVMDIPEAAQEHLFSKFQKSPDLDTAIRKIESEFYSLISSNKGGKTLYPYQEKAINEFLENGGCHFYEMATGTGKTFTAIKTIQQLIDNKVCDKLYVAIVVPQVDLQVQWKREIESCGIKPFLFGGIGNSADWDEAFDESIIKYFDGDALTVAICVYDTYFQKLYKKIDNVSITKMIIADEAHELSTNQIPKLSDKYKYRLGLSATPERSSKEESDAIISYFTKGTINTYKYTIDKAIENGFLSHYLYYPILVHLTESEFESYQNYTQRLVILLNEDERDYQKIQEVCNNRSLIVKKAANKPLRLREMILSNNYSFRNAVVYCGQGKDPESDSKIIDIVTQYLSNDGNYKVSQFTSNTLDRPQVLTEFENGYYDTLVAIKCFDQGVDVPKLDKIYIMASDSLMRQTIQRRGRVLRKCTETGKKIAYIYDMITLPPEDKDSEFGCQALVVKELKRAEEYARLADNQDEINSVLQNIRDFYGVQEEIDDEEEIFY